MDGNFALEMAGLLIFYCILMGLIGLIGFGFKWLNRALWAGLAYGTYELWKKDHPTWVGVMPASTGLTSDDDPPPGIGAEVAPPNPGKM